MRVLYRTIACLVTGCGPYLYMISYINPPILGPFIILFCPENCFVPERGVREREQFFFLILKEVKHAKQ